MATNEQVVAQAEVNTAADRDFGARGGHHIEHAFRAADCTYAEAVTLSTAGGLGRTRVLTDLGWVGVLTQIPG